MTQKERFIVGSTRSARTASVNKQEGEKEKKKEKKRKISWVIIFDRCARAKSNFADRLPSSAEHVDARVLHAVYVCVLCKLFHLSLSLSLAPFPNINRCLFFATPNVQYRSKLTLLLLISIQIYLILRSFDGWLPQTEASEAEVERVFSRRKEKFLFIFSPGTVF